MLTFKEISNRFQPLDWVRRKLVFSSPLGAVKLASTPLGTSAEMLGLEYDRMDRLAALLGSKQGKEFRERIVHTLGTFRDIGTILEDIKEGLTLSELDLFEVKYFSFNYEYFSSLTREYGLVLYPIEDLIPVFQLLDPDRTGVSSFYLYDSYSPELAALRKRIKAGEDSEALYQQAETAGYRIREMLSAGLRPFASSLRAALETVACWDLLIAKVLFAQSCTSCRPDFCEYGGLSYSGLCNPYLKAILEQDGEVCQPVDIALPAGPTLITGANMSGKTMVLKSVALAQYLVQFGFYAPAASAQVALVAEVMLLSGDTQNEARGLSSFGAEILAVSHIVETVCSGKKVLVLLDEPARTTSPDEGVAIVDAILEILTEQKTVSMVTTHYNRLKTKCRCLRVKGFMEEQARGRVNCENINRFIDYRLIDATVNEGTSEALTVARLLKVSNKLLMKIDSGQQKNARSQNKQDCDVQRK